MSVTFLLALILNVVAVVLIYHLFLEASRAIYRKGREWLVSFLIFLSPFVYVLAQVRDLPDLMWKLLLTPFSAIITLVLEEPQRMFLYYLVAFGIVALSHRIYCRRARISTPRRMNHKGSSTFMLNLRKYLCLGLLVVVSTSFVVSAGDGVRDPTEQEVLQFAARDKTDQNRYVENSYTCYSFASDFRENALKAGYRCGVVIAYFSSMSHALNCFSTADCGLIFIEPQTDHVVPLTAGQPFWDRDAYELPDYNDTVQWYRIIW